MTALGGGEKGAAGKGAKSERLCEERGSKPERLQVGVVTDVAPRTRRLLLVLPAVLMGFISLCLLTAYFCVTLPGPPVRHHNRSDIHEEKFLLVASHDGHRTWNHVTVDGTENIVEVEVPTFGQFHQSVIIYDFEEGFMANKDIDRKRCFLKRIHEYLEGSLENLNTLKGTNTTLYLNDVPVTALPGVIPEPLIRSTAGDRLADLCSGQSSYWLVLPTVRGGTSNQTSVNYSTGRSPVVPMDTCDVRVADILFCSLCAIFTTDIRMNFLERKT